MDLIMKKRTKFVEDIPDWSNADALSGAEFTQLYHRTVFYFSSSKSPTQLKKSLVKWMRTKNYSTQQVESVLDTEQLMITAGAVASALLAGMPPQHPGFNSGKDTELWLHSQIVKVTPSVTKLRHEFLEKLDCCIDNWIQAKGNYEFDTTQLSNLKLEPGDVDYITQLLAELDSIDSCEQLSEAYSQYQNINAFKSFLSSLL